MKPRSRLPGKFPPALVGPWIPLALAISASALPFWLFDAIPFQDLPAHAGLIALRHRFAHSAFDQRFYVVAPHLGPYSLFRFLGEILDERFGPIDAVRTLATLPVVMTPIALSWARRRLHDDPYPSVPFYGVALGFGFMTLLGFASYLLGVTTIVVGLTLWLELLTTTDSRVGFRREVAVACFAPLIFIAHGDAFVVFLGLAATSAVATGNRLRRTLRLRALAPAIALAASAAWRDRVARVPEGAAAVPGGGLRLHFQGIADKLSLLVTPTLMTRYGVDVLVGLFVWGVVGAAVVATARTLAVAKTTPDSGGDPGAGDRAARDEASRAHSRALIGSLAALGGAFVVLPHSVGWFGFVDGRLVPLLILVGMMTVRRPALGPMLRTVFDRGAPIAAFASVTIALVASVRFQAEAFGWREVLASVPAEARLLNFPIEPNSDVFTAHPFVHYDKLVLADRPVVVSDLWFHQGSAVYPTAENPAIRLPAEYIESDLHGIDWPAYRLADWDYVLIRTRPGADRPDVPRVLSLAVHRGGWWLFRRAVPEL